MTNENSNQTLDLFQEQQAYKELKIDCIGGMEEELLLRVRDGARYWPCILLFIFTTW